MSTKFILTVDEATANKFIAAGFKLMSRSGNGYLFLNHPPKNFSFEQVDKTKVFYTNMLTF